MYTSGRHIGLRSRRLNWRRRVPVRRWTPLGGAAPLRQAHDTLRPADWGVSDAPAEQEPRPFGQFRQALRSHRYKHVGRRLPPFVRYPFPGGRFQYSEGAGAPWPQRRQDDDDLHPCPQPWTGRGSQPGRRTLRPSRRFYADPKGLSQPWQMDQRRVILTGTQSSASCAGPPNRCSA